MGRKKEEEEEKKPTTTGFGGGGQGRGRERKEKSPVFQLPKSCQSSLCVLITLETNTVGLDLMATGIASSISEFGEVSKKWLTPRVQT